MSSSAGIASGSTQPSSILFFIAVAIGVVIAVIFIFFSIRYYVRTKLGIYATARISSANGSDIVLLSGDFSMQPHTPYHHDSEIMRRRRNRNARRRRRRYMKKKRLTEEEVNHFFPTRTYRDWLDGGAERDANTRDIHEQLKEEHNNFTEKQNESKIKNIDNQVLKATDTKNSNNTQIIHQETSIIPSFTTNPTDHVDLGTEIHYDSGSCAICIEIFNENDQVRGLICGHVFHQECLDPWLIKRKACCPMCKRDYYLKNRTENNEAENNINNTHNNNDNDDNYDDRDDDDDDDSNSMTQFAELQYATLDERVQEILSRSPDIEQVAKDNMQRYLTFKWRIFWVIMSISKQDLINSAIIAEDRKRTEASQAQSTQPESADQETNDNDETPADAQEESTHQERERNRTRAEAIV